VTHALAARRGAAVGAPRWGGCGAGRL